MTFGEKLRNYLAAAKATANADKKPWTSDDWVRAVNEFADVERPLGKDGKTARRKTPIAKMTEEEFWAWLRAQPHLAGIDIDREVNGLRMWCEAKGVQLTRMRIVNCLNRKDKVLTKLGRDPTARAETVAERARTLPESWREFAKTKLKEAQLAEPDRSFGVVEYAIETDDFYKLPPSWRAEFWASLRT